MSEKETKGAEYDFYGKLPLCKAIPLGLQHVLAMFVGNLTPLLIITGACGLTNTQEFANLQVDLLQNAMLVAGIVTLVQLYAIGPPCRLPPETGWAGSPPFPVRNKYNPGSWF